jgi:outer membrane protein assembly factor BamA
VIAVSCNTTKRLEQGEYLLKKNRIELEDNIDVDKDALDETIRPQTNRRVFGLFPIYVWAYNVPDPDKIERKNEKRLEKLEKKNAKRRKKGKEPKEFKPYGSWWRETVGEAPVLYDSTAVNRSEKQLQTYLIKHGWFNATVSSQSKLNEDKNTAVVTYIINGGEPYAIESFQLDIPDNRLKSLTADSRKGRKTLQPGSQFNIDQLDKEREKLTTYFRNRGYYNFNKELIYFDVDSNLNSHGVELTLGIVPRKIPYSGDPDSLLIVDYRRFKIADITITDQPALINKSAPVIDTTQIRGYKILNRDQLKVKPRILAQNLLFKSGEYYDLEEVTRTYKRLGALPIVRAVSIQFTPVNEGADNTELNCTVTLSPTPKQNISFGARGTNRGGFLGISGKVGYQNKNIFRGAEKLNINVSGGVEAQQLLTESQNLSGAQNDVSNNFNLNTIEFGPEISLTFPKFLLPLGPDKFAKSAAPKTTLTANLSYQRRPDYERTRSFSSIAYKWSESDEKKWVISPLEVSLIKIFRSQEFDNQLQEIGDPFLTNSFQDHFIVDTRIGYTFNTQKPGSKKRNFYYYYGELESSGNLLRELFELSNAKKNEMGSYEVLDITFSQYIKTQHDFRYYRSHNEKMSTAYRITGGLGVPLKNLNVLPFEKSFFAGGTNDIRAWQARTLGPGSYRDPDVNFDKIGDVLIEANIEYRFDIIKLLEGAFFADAGNIWTINSDPARPGAEFETDRFLSEIAFGAGAGMRFNFNFFLIRLDLALQLKDPALDPGERWLFQPKNEYNEYIRNLNESRSPDRQLASYAWRWNINIGIGYPF